MFKFVFLFAVLAVACADPQYITAYHVAAPAGPVLDTYPASVPVVAVHPAIHPGVLPGVLPAVHPGVLPAVHPAVLPSVHPAVHPGVLPVVHPAVHPELSLAPQHPATLVGATGVPLDTPEVAAAKSLHYAAKNLAYHGIHK